jgi:hypothetical protein
MKVIVDRIEGEYAVCELENRQMTNIPLIEIPFSVKEGDVLSIDGNYYKIDVEETQSRKKKIEDMVNELWE